ncbi:hypothetical protein PIROE2DRAFT_11751 [Piromyces sp. E2]|nr:hypothetical protein PIROE2DRAFT_11751 [Piromyces sp. E2]|eukprot:OUM62047.1 hypothetical protein PIROE2DRAFT_11751 [Piromyces sp. E2]
MKKQFLNNIKDAKNHSVNELVINLNDETYEFLENINIESPIEKLHIKGNSKDNAVLQFNKITDGVINVILEDSNINGSIDIDKTLIIDEENMNEEYYEDDYPKNYMNVTVSMKNIIFNGLTDSKFNCINLYGNVKIDQSKFYGSPLFENSILSYNGESRNTIKISNSYFNGVYSNNCISMDNGIFADINSSEFENCSSHLEPQHLTDG